LKLKASILKKNHTGYGNGIRTNDMDLQYSIQLLQVMICHYLKIEATGPKLIGIFISKKRKS
jgi:hypothetical protein